MRTIPVILLSLFPCFATCQHYVGELYGGGIVFYVYENGAHGLICSLHDLSEGEIWGGVGTDISAGNGAESLHNGRANSEAIVSELKSRPSAAKLCVEYRGGDFSDWYLPSIMELNTLYANSWVITTILESDGDKSTRGMLLADYWHSSELNANEIINFKWYNNSSREASFYKQTSFPVRAIRKF